MQQLRSKGVQVELILIEKVPFHRVKELYAQADIGVDQMLYGWHGKVSLELMGMGKPVVCYLDEELVRKYRPNIPIVNASPTDLAAKLEWLCNDEHARRDLAARGIEYVRQHHDVERVIDQCLEIYSAAGLRAGAKWAGGKMSAAPESRARAGANSHG